MWLLATVLFLLLLNHDLTFFPKEQQQESNIITHKFEFNVVQKLKFTNKLVLHLRQLIGQDKIRTYDMQEIYTLM